MMCLFEEAVWVIDMHDLDLVCAPLHFGGAACLFVKHTCVPQLQYPGRWRTLAALLHYLQEAVGGTIFVVTLAAARDNIQAARAFFLPVRTARIALVRMRGPQNPDDEALRMVRGLTVPPRHEKAVPQT